MDSEKSASSQVEPCPGTVGSKPWWMSRDQYEADGGPCPCIKPNGHKPPCGCDHTEEAP